jgi:hypothetical protein
MESRADRWSTEDVGTRTVVAAGLFVLCGVLAVEGGAGTKRRLAISVASAVVSPRDHVVVRVSGSRPGTRLHLVLHVEPPSETPPVVLGTVTADRDGYARLVVRLPELGPAVYEVAAAQGKGFVAGRGRLSVRARPPAGFGALGTAGCAPASPRNQTATGLGAAEVFGTSAGAQFWALSAAQPAGTEATLSGVVGKTTKIIFKLTSGVPRVFYAIAPDDSRVAPVWGPSPHLGSNWDRPGAEWGAGFVFAEPGCWQIHAGTTPAQGDIFVDVIS